ncbi:MAG: OmpA family protein, partial [Bacteroidota bacterium]
GSAAIASRYVVMTDPSQTIAFADTTIPGGTLQKHYHMLNIIGYRMRRYPATRITVTGCNSAEKANGENQELSANRAETIINYLTEVWGIDQSRITTVSRNLPAIPADLGDSLGIAENRRVEITSADWDITKPIVNIDFRRFPQPDTMHFQMKNGVPDSLVTSREIEITWGGKPWHVMRTIGIADPVSPAYAWTKDDADGSEPYDFPGRSTPYSARLTVHLRDGSVLHSSDITIPVLIINGSNKRFICRLGPPRSIYSIVLFGFDHAALTGFNQRVLREYVYSDIAKMKGEVDVLGHTDIIGTERHNLGLSRMRASSVVSDIAKVMGKSTAYKTNPRGRGVGEDDPLYPNDLPEGRFYNRTVQVRITEREPPNDY